MKITRKELRRIVMAEAGRWMSTPQQRQPRVFNPPPVAGEDAYYRSPEASDSLRPSQRPSLDIDMSTLLDEVPPEKEFDPYDLSDVDDENTPGYDGPINEKKEKAKKSDYWYQGSLRKDYKHDDEWFNIGGFSYDDEDEEAEY